MPRFFSARSRFSLSDAGKSGRRQIKPFVRLHIVPCHALTMGLADTKVVLGSRVALVGRETKPLHGLRIVLRHAFA